MLGDSVALRGQSPLNIDPHALIILGVCLGSSAFGSTRTGMHYDGRDQIHVTSSS